MGRGAGVLIGILIVLLLNTPHSATSTDLVTDFHLTQTHLDIERNWSLNIILVNYNSSLINETILLETLPHNRTHYTATTWITYNVEYNLFFADESYSNNLRAFVIDNSVTGNIGTEINETALGMQKDNITVPRRVFNPRSGRSIDGYAVEDWLLDYPYVPSPDLGYNFYLLNFSEFDSLDHNDEHWFDYHPVDPDTGVSQDWFRLEFDHNLNPPIMMQSAGIGGRGNIYALDPTADQWYLRWARIWWSDYITTEYDHWTMDLEDKMRSVDLNSYSGLQSLNEYLRDYMTDIIAYLLFPYQNQPVKYVTSGEILINVICLDYAQGVHVGSLTWVTDAEKQRAQVEELIPFIDWTVEVNFLDADQEPVWETTFWNYAHTNPEGIVEVDGSALFEYILEIMRPYRIHTGTDHVNVFGVVFVKQDMLMYLSDETYTGLGFSSPDGGQTLVCKSLNRYYQSDNVTPREGVTAIQLHETMHSLGFSHTWQHEHYASDFSFGPMTYFSMHNGSSSFDRNWAQGTYLDQMEAQLWNEFQSRRVVLDDDAFQKAYLAEDQALHYFQKAGIAYDEMNWTEAYSALIKARDWTRRMLYSARDDTLPVIDEWEIQFDSGFSTGFHYSAHVTDRSGIENATLNVQVDDGVISTYSCIQSYNNWGVYVPTLDYTDNATIWLIVHDWGMNRAEGGYVRLPPPHPTDPPNYLLVIGLIVLVGGVIIWTARNIVRDYK
jgi:hypothetical protein